jgi:beta-galactosidase
MKLSHKIFTGLMVFGAVANAQIQKINYTTTDNQVLKLNRISPGSSSQPNKISLDGTWKFSTDIKASPCDKNIKVPGEWLMQGFTVAKNAVAGYQRSFTIPKNWANKRLKLRFDAVFSEAEVFVNGKSAGTHLGGFTPFEIDINNFVKWDGANEVLVKVKSETKADSLASASTYALHNLGGISRKVYLMAVPTVNFAYADVKTTFDKNYENATLSADVIIANETSKKINGLSIKAELFKADGKTKVDGKTVATGKAIVQNQHLQQNLSFDVKSPNKWDTEHPYLYVLKISILQNNKLADVITKQIGFRQIEVRGAQVFVNNMAVKLRGVCHHETMPLRGRSVNDNMWEKDVEIFRRANVNYIRTSHYPPAEELVDACNRLGMFLEVEAPFCWADRMKPAILPETDLYQTLLVDQTLDMVNQYRTEPSVLIWSLGNESNKYEEYFKGTGKLVKQFDPTRPRNFSQWSPNADKGELEIANHHYPGPTGPEKYKDYKRPIVFDEYVHLNAYNRLELVTDPGVRDVWGIGLEAMWEDMYKTDAVLGGALWAAIDDTFFLPDGKTVGYGTWGPIDGFRREKPEYWHMKKSYSPVKIKLVNSWNNSKVGIELENRMLFSNLNECRIEWTTGTEKGVIKADAQRNGKTTIEIPVEKKPSQTDKMTINVYDPRGVLVDTYQFNLLQKNNGTALAQSAVKNWVYAKNGNILQAKSDKTSISFNLSTGDIEKITDNEKEIWNAGSRLMVLPLTAEGRGIQMTGGSQEFDPFTDVCHNRKVGKIELDTTKNNFAFHVTDAYAEASGTTDYTFFANGELKITYKYTIQKDVNPRQWGLVFSLPSSFQELSWDRNGLWNYYPDDHIGRNNGSAKLISANAVSGPAGPSKLPTSSWSLDRSELGTNDFRSTKMYINTAKLSNGSSFFNVPSNGKQHFRAWLDAKTGIKALVAGYSNMGAGQYFRDHAKKMDQPLKKGDVISDTIYLQLK